MTAARLVYLVGPPGVGKSSALAAALAGWAVVPNPRWTPVPTMAVVEPSTGRVVALELGKRRDRFSGTDALSMSIAPIARQWISTRPHPLIIAEGARLAIRSFFIEAMDAGYALTVLAFQAPANVLAQRCAERGSKQSTAWAKGAETRAAKITQWAGEHAGLHTINAEQSLNTIAETVRSVIMPSVGAER